MRKKKGKNPEIPMLSCSINFCTIGFHKSMLVARGAITQLDPSCLSVPLATNMNLFVCFAECLFKSSSISH